MKKLGETSKKIYISRIRLDVIDDLEGLIIKSERNKHEIPCNIQPELDVLIKARYDAKIALLRKLIETAEICNFDLPELYLESKIERLKSLEEPIVYTEEE